MITLIEERGTDVVDFEPMENPYILPTPSGHSFSFTSVQGLIQTNLLSCPTTREAFDPDRIIPNINLRLFFEAWPNCQDLLIQNIKEQEENNGKKRKFEEQEQVQEPEENKTKKRKFDPL